VKKPAYRSPSELADELTRKHAWACDECRVSDELCTFHLGYREGVTMLLLRASVMS